MDPKKKKTRSPSCPVRLQSHAALTVKESAHANIPPFSASRGEYSDFSSISSAPSRLRSASDVLRICPSYSGGAAPDFHRLPLQRSAIFSFLAAPRAASSRKSRWPRDDPKKIKIPHRRRNCSTGYIADSSPGPRTFFDIGQVSWLSVYPQRRLPALRSGICLLVADYSRGSCEGITPCFPFKDFRPPHVALFNYETLFVNV